MLTFISKQITTELDTLKALQSLEFACAVRGIDKAKIATNSPFFYELAQEFNFSRFVISETIEDGGLQIDKICAYAFWGPYYITSVSDMLDHDLGKSTESYTQTDLRDGFIVKFNRHNKLGDALGICTGLDAYAKFNRINRIKITGKGAFKDVMEAFEFKNLEYVEDKDDEAVNFDPIFRLASWGYPWLRRFELALFNCLGGERALEIEAPKYQASNISRNGKRAKILCQFDSRSSADWSPELIRKIIRSICGRNHVVILGGPDTPHYLGEDYVYQTGNLQEICQELKDCSLFVGADSGLAHVAGILNVPGYVVNFTDFDPVYCFFKDYKSLRVINKELTIAPAYNSGFKRNISIARL